MSNISNRHSIVPFISGTSKPLSGQELLKITYKSSTDKKTKIVTPAKFPSVCASVPALTWDSVLPELELFKGHILGFLRDSRQAVARGLYEAKKGKLEALTDEDLSLSAIAGFLSAQGQGKLSIEKIGKFFDSAMIESVTVAVIDKCKFDIETLNDEQNKTVKHHVGDIKSALESLAVPALLAESVYRKCLAVLALLGELEDAAESAMLERLIETAEGKIAAIEAKREEEKALAAIPALSWE